MAFNINLFERWSDGVAVGVNNMWAYTKTDETMATIVGAGYFNSLITATDSTIKVNDIIWIQASDAQQFATVTSITAPVTVAPFSVVLGAGSVGTANIANGAVTLAKLAAGITPSHVIKFGAQYTTVGGAAAEAINVVGVAATDLAFVQVKDNGTNNVTVLQAACTLNTLTVTFSADPGNDCIIYYQVIRAAA